MCINKYELYTVSEPILLRVTVDSLLLMKVILFTLFSDKYIKKKCFPSGSSPFLVLELTFYCC